MILWHIVHGYNTRSETKKKEHLLKTLSERLRVAMKTSGDHAPGDKAVKSIPDGATPVGTCPKSMRGLWSQTVGVASEANAATRRIDTLREQLAEAEAERSELKSQHRALLQILVKIIGETFPDIPGNAVAMTVDWELYIPPSNDEMSGPEDMESFSRRLFESEDPTGASSQDALPDFIIDQIVEQIGATRVAFDDLAPHEQERLRTQVSGFNDADDVCLRRNDGTIGVLHILSGVGLPMTDDSGLAGLAEILRRSIGQRSLESLEECGCPGCMRELARRKKAH